MGMKIPLRYVFSIFLTLCICGSLDVTATELIRLNVCVPFGNDYWLYRNGVLVLHRVGENPITVHNPAFIEKYSEVASTTPGLSPLPPNDRCIVRPADEVSTQVQYTIRVSGWDASKTETRSFFFESSESDDPESITNKRSNWKCSTVSDSDPSTSLIVPPAWASLTFDDSTWTNAVLSRRLDVNGTITSDYCEFATGPAQRVWVQKENSQLGPNKEASKVVCRATISADNPDEVAETNATSTLYPTSNSLRHQPSLWLQFDQTTSKSGPYSKEWKLQYCPVGGDDASNTDLRTAVDMSGSNLHGSIITSGQDGVVIPSSAGIPSFVVPGIIGSGIQDVASGALGVESTFASFSGVSSLYPPFTLAYWMKLQTLSGDSSSHNSFKFVAGNCVGDDISGSLVASTTDDEVKTQLTAKGCSFAILSKRSLVEKEASLGVYIRDGNNQVHYFTSHRTLRNGEFQHIAVSVSSSEVRVFFNGMPDRFYSPAPQHLPLTMMPVVGSPFHVFAKRALGNMYNDHAILVVDDLRIIPHACTAVDLLHLTSIPNTQLMAARLDVNHGQILVKTTNIIPLAQFRRRSKPAELVIEIDQHDTVNRIHVSVDEVFHYSDITDPLTWNGFVFGIQLAAKQKSEIFNAAENLKGERTRTGNLHSLRMRYFESKFEWENADQLCTREGQGWQLCSWHHLCVEETKSASTVADSVEEAARESGKVPPQQGSWLPVSDGYGHWVDITTCEMAAQVGSSNDLSTGMVACCSGAFPSPPRVTFQNVHDGVGQPVVTSEVAAPFELNFDDVLEDPVIPEQSFKTVQAVLSCETGLLGMGFTTPSILAPADLTALSEITLSFVGKDSTVVYTAFRNYESTQRNNFQMMEEPQAFHVLSIEDPAIALQELCTSSEQVLLNVDAGLFIATDNLPNLASEISVTVPLKVVQSNPTRIVDYDDVFDQYGNYTLTVTYNQPVTVVQYAPRVHVIDSHAHTQVAEPQVQVYASSNRVIVEIGERLLLEDGRTYHFRLSGVLLNGLLWDETLTLPVEYGTQMTSKNDCGMYMNAVFEQVGDVDFISKGLMTSSHDPNSNGAIFVGSCSSEPPRVFREFHVSGDTMLSSNHFDSSSAPISRFHVLESPAIKLSGPQTIHFNIRGEAFGSVDWPDPSSYDCATTSAASAIGVALEVHEPQSRSWQVAKFHSPISASSWENVTWSLDDELSLELSTEVRHRIALGLEVAARVRVYQWGAGWLEVKQLGITDGCVAANEVMRLSNLLTDQRNLPLIQDEGFLEGSSGMLYRRNFVHQEGLLVSGDGCGSDRSSVFSRSIPVGEKSRGALLSFFAKLESPVSATADISSSFASQASRRVIAASTTSINDSEWTKIVLRAPVWDQYEHVGFHIEALNEASNCSVVAIHNLTFSQTEGDVEVDGCEAHTPLEVHRTSGKINDAGMPMGTFYESSGTNSSFMWPEVLEWTPSDHVCQQGQPTTCGFTSDYPLTDVPSIMLNFGNVTTISGIFLGQNVLEVAVQVQGVQGIWAWIDGAPISSSDLVGSAARLNVNDGLVSFTTPKTASQIRLFVITWQSPGTMSSISLEVVPVACRGHHDIASDSCSMGESHNEAGLSLSWTLGVSDSSELLRKHGRLQLTQLESLRNAIGNCNVCESPVRLDELSDNLANGLLWYGSLRNSSACTVGVWLHQRTGLSDDLSFDLEFVATTENGSGLVKEVLEIDAWTNMGSGMPFAALRHVANSSASWESVVKLTNVEWPTSSGVVALVHTSDSYRLLVLDGTSLELVYDITDVIPLARPQSIPHHMHGREGHVVMTWSTSPPIVQVIQLPESKGAMTPQFNAWDTANFEFGQHSAWGAVVGKHVRTMYVGVDGGVVQQPLDIPIPSSRRQLRFSALGLNTHQVMLTGALAETKRCAGEFERSEKDKTWDRPDCPWIALRAFFGTSDGLVVEIDTNLLSLSAKADAALYTTLTGRIAVSHVLHIDSVNAEITGKLLALVASQDGEELLVFDIGSATEKGTLKHFKTISLPQRDSITGHVQSMTQISGEGSEFGARGVSLVFDDGFVLVIDACILYSESITTEICSALESSTENPWAWSCQKSLTCSFGACLPTEALKDGSLCSVSGDHSRGVCQSARCESQPVQKRSSWCWGLQCPMHISFPGGIQPRPSLPNRNLTFSSPALVSVSGGKVSIVVDRGEELVVDLDHEQIEFSGSKAPLETWDSAEMSNIAESGALLLDIDGDGDLDLLLLLDAPHLHGVDAFLVLRWNGDQFERVSLSTKALPLLFKFGASLHSIPTQPWSNSDEPAVMVQVQGQLTVNDQNVFESQTSFPPKVSSGDLVTHVKNEIPLWVPSKQLRDGQLAAYNLSVVASGVMINSEKPVKHVSLRVVGGAELPYGQVLPLECSSSSGSPVELEMFSTGTDLWKLQGTETQCGSSGECRHEFHCKAGQVQNTSSPVEADHGKLVELLSWDLNGDMADDVIQVMESGVLTWIVNSTSGLDLEPENLIGLETNVSSACLLGFNNKTSEPSLVMLSPDGYLDGILLSGRQTENATSSNASTTQFPENSVYRFQTVHGEVQNGKLFGMHGNNDSIPDLLVVGQLEPMKVGAQLHFSTIEGDDLPSDGRDIKFEPVTIWEQDVMGFGESIEASVRSVQVGDLDNDGDFDVAILLEQVLGASEVKTTVVILEQVSEVVYNAKVLMMPNCMDILILSLNSDEWLDILCRTESQFDAHLGPVIHHVHDYPHQAGMALVQYPSFPVAIINN